MHNDREVYRGAQRIIQRCLGLSRGQNLVIFFDETAVQISLIIAEVAMQLEIPTTLILIPVTEQIRIPQASEISLPAQGAAKEARAILTCINAKPECLPFREQILETQWSARTRIGHMPGASIEVLQLANVDFDQLIMDCHRLEVAMARGKTLELFSYTEKGTPHYLKVDIGGWERLPVASDGVISDGVWGNVPSGETYISPLEGSAEGSVVINGAIPGLVIKPDEEIVLHFKQGRCIKIDPGDNATSRYLYQTHLKSAEEKGDQNWSNLAEIGIGVNPAVNQLTGKTLFDEKATGTAHIALGSNTFMGGNVESSIHCDMVIKAPTININGKTILDRGNLRFVESEWHENYADISLSGSPFHRKVTVVRSGTQARFKDRKLQRVLRSEPGRVSACFVGDHETSQLAYHIYQQLPADSDWVGVEDLASCTGLALETACRVLHLIWEYGLVHYH